MADLIELDLVVRDKTLKASISTVARLEREIIKAQKAVDSNTISQARYNKVLLSAKREYQALGVSSQKATAQVRNFAAAQAQASKATNSFAAGLGLSGKGINRLGVGMQQAGYQVGDFAVQLQGGTNAAVALGQQGSQLLGIFGPAGAIAGAGLAIATAFIAPMIKAKEAADQVGVSIDAVFDRIIARSGSIGKLLEVTFSGPLELARQRFLGIEDVFKRLDEKTLLGKLGDEGSELNVVLQELNDTFAENDKLITQGAKRTGGLSGIALSEKELKNLKDAQRAIVTFQGDLGIALRGPTEDIAKGFVEAYATLQDMSSVVAEGIAPEFKRLLEDTGLYAQYQEELLQAAEEQNEKDRERAQSQAEFAANAISAGSAAISAEEAILKAYNEKLQALRDVADLNGTILQSENDQEAVLRTKQDIQRRSLSVYIDEADLTNEQAANLLHALAIIQKQERELLKVAQNTADAKEEAKLFAAAMKDVLSAMSQIDRFGLSLKDKLAKITASNEAIKKGLDGQIAGEIQLLKIQRDRLTLGLDRDDILAKSTELRQIDDTIAAYEEQLELNNKLTKSNKKGTKAVKDNRTAYEKAIMTAKEFADTLDNMVISAVDGVSNAFSDFLQRGMSDFKSFVKSIGDMFLKLLADMAAAALKRQILIPIATGMAAGFGSTAAASTIGSGAGSFAAGTIGSSLAAGGTALGAGITTSLGLGTTTTGATAMAMSPTMASIGAAIPYIVAIAAVIGLFTKKTKLLDSGLRTTVEGFDVAIETFKKTQTSRLFGLLKGSKKTSYEAASAEVADPLVQAIGDMQQSIVDAAGTLGIGAEAFDDFSYQFKLSLKGLTEEEQLQKINEEITKMGDSFASLTGIFSNMNELLSVAQERYNLEVQLLQVQGDVVELRRRELEAINVLNRGLAARLQLLQAEGELQGALAAFAAGISEQQGLIRRAVDALVSPLIEAINRTKTQAEKSYAIFRAAADNTRSEAQNIVDIIAGALSSRTIQSEAVELLRYRQAQQQLSSFADGASFDESSLRKATEGVSVDSTKFFGSFEDYARDFYKTQISLTKLAEKAEGELTDVEKQIDVAEKAYQVAMGTYEEAQDFNVALNTLINDLATFTEVSARNEPFIDQIKAEGDRQVELLDSILVETTKQINALSGIDDTIADLVGSNVSVGEALSVLGLEGGELAGAVLALDPTIGAIGSHVEALDLTLSGAIDRLGLTLSELEGLDLSEGFLSLDLTSGLETNILGLTTEVSALDTAASGLNLGVVGLDGTIGILVSSVDKQASNILTLDGTVVSQTVAVDALSGEVSYLSSNVVNLDGTVYGLGTNVSDLGMSTDNLGVNINDLGTTLSNAMSGLGSIVSGLSGAVSGLAASNDALASAQKSAAEAQVNAAVAQIISPIQGNVQSKAEAEAALIAAQEALLSTSTTKTETYKYGGIFGLFRKTGTRIVENPAYAQLQDDIEKLSGTIAKEEAILAPAREQIKALGVTPEFASGGMHSGGMRLVGERGPELEVTGPSRIYSAQQTKNMLSGGSGEVISELRSLRREVSELKSEQRKVGVENVKYNKKSYDLYREWDTIGLPATRTS